LKKKIRKPLKNFSSRIKIKGKKIIQKRGFFYDSNEVKKPKKVIQT
jgi:hypothetical protein